MLSQTHLNNIVYIYYYIPMKERLFVNHGPSLPRQFPCAMYRHIHRSRQHMQTRLATPGGWGVMPHPPLTHTHIHTHTHTHTHTQLSCVTKENKGSKGEQKEFQNRNY